MQQQPEQASHEQVIPQVDFAPTMAALLGVPTPFGSIGKLSPGLWNVGHSLNDSASQASYMQALQSNAQQVCPKTHYRWCFTLHLAINCSQALQHTAYNSCRMLLLVCVQPGHVHAVVHVSVTVGKAQSEERKFDCTDKRNSAQSKKTRLTSHACTSIKCHFNAHRLILAQTSGCHFTQLRLISRTSFHAPREMHSSKHDEHMLLQVHTYLTRYAEHPRASIPQAALAKLNQLYTAAWLPASGQHGKASQSETEQAASMDRCAIGYSLLTLHSLLCITHSQHSEFCLLTPASIPANMQA